MKKKDRRSREGAEKDKARVETKQRRTKEGARGRRRIKQRRRREGAEKEQRSRREKQREEKEQQRRREGAAKELPGNYLILIKVFFEAPYHNLSSWICLRCLERRTTISQMVV